AGFYALASRTPGAANGPYRSSPVVINELMYNPITGNNDDEYVELYNRSGAPADVSRWKFTAGINFTIPTNTIIPPDGYLVIAKNVTHLLAHYPNLNTGNTLGNYGGTLGNGGDRVALARPDLLTGTETNGVPFTNTLHVVVNEVTYQKGGGRWGYWAGGGGGRLALGRPPSDKRLGANWADSDETGKGQWTNFEFTGGLGETLASPVGDNLEIFLLGIGECLIDEVEVHVNGGPNLITNPGFESGITGWTPQGSHDFS